jgi:uncharacterized glyoxalase superfamily protein PhnB
MAVVIPYIRITNLSQAYDFYQEWLGFKELWSESIGDEENLQNDYLYPSLMKFRHETLGIDVLLSEHSSDGQPGGVVLIDQIDDVRKFLTDLMEKELGFQEPVLEEPNFWIQAYQITITDPFGNRLIFRERPVRETPWIP